ncbi:hypothetical protein BROUX41_006760 [Berkeleyomyces rouxiae]
MPASSSVLPSYIEAPTDQHLVLDPRHTLPRKRANQFLPPSPTLTASQSTLHPVPRNQPRASPSWETLVSIYPKHQIEQQKLHPCLYGPAPVPLVNLVHYYSRNSDVVPPQASLDRHGSGLRRWMDLANWVYYHVDDED